MTWTVNGYPAPFVPSCPQNAPLTPAQITAIQAQITAAEQAYTQLMTGQSVVSLRDQNGEQLTFSQIKKSDLRVYISQLRASLPSGATLAVDWPRPMRPYF